MTSAGTLKPKPAGHDHGAGSAMLAEIDWRAPWLHSWRAVGEAAAQRVNAGEPQPDALNALATTVWPTALQLPMRFVPQDDLPVGMAYESYIFESGQCPTREGLHDFFNGLAWLHFPQTKRRLNHLHVAQIAQTGIAPCVARRVTRSPCLTKTLRCCVRQMPCGMRWRAKTGSAFLVTCEACGQSLFWCCLVTPCWKSWFFQENQPQRTSTGRFKLLIQ